MEVPMERYITNTNCTKPTIEEPIINDNTNNIIVRVDEDNNKAIHPPTEQPDKPADTQKDVGVAKLKREYVLTLEERAARQQLSEESAAKRPKQELQEEKKDKKRRRRGQNKGRPPPWKEERSHALCQSLVDVAEGEPWPACERGRCEFMHDMTAYLASKPADLGPQCYVFHLLGRCPRGASCRYGSEHLTADGHNKVDPELYQADRAPTSINMLAKELQFKLRKFKYEFKRSDKTLESVRKQMSLEKPVGKATDQRPITEGISETQNATPAQGEVESKTAVAPESEVAASVEAKESSVGPVPDEDLVKIRSGEKKTINWKDKLYLSPLTTLGNLPFRRICKGLGADVTCGEMALATCLLQGMQQEWALVRRHESENLFGVQICGSNPYCMVKCAQMLQENVSVDFVDINMGCPIDMIYTQGAGSGLLRRRPTLQTMVRAMSQVLSVPLTIKTRTGVSSGHNTAHTLMPSLHSWGVSLVTLHGRSREQRYTRCADWDYIDQCAQLASPVPLFGNGDILSYEDYNLRRANSSVSGVMIGRGALIKPWVFTEIKEQRHWDISSKERLDILRQFVHNGLEHWGSDSKGVENTRRFLLEWLSFLHRYIPVGLLEHPPQRINERPPSYRGRDDLETLMASPNCADWVTISEMLLGKVPDGFNFLPKHKANSWG